MSVTTASLLPADKPARRQDEDKFHRQVVSYLRWSLPADADFKHTPNGGLRSKTAAKKLVPLGTKAGHPDLDLCWRGKVFSIELKTPKGALSAIQKQRHRKLEHCGWPVYVCRDLDEVEAVLRQVGVPLLAKVAAT